MLYRPTRWKDKAFGSGPPCYPPLAPRQARRPGPGRQARITRGSYQCAAARPLAGPDAPVPRLRGTLREGAARLAGNAVRPGIAWGHHNARARGRQTPSARPKRTAANLAGRSQVGGNCRFDGEPSPLVCHEERYSLGTTGTRPSPGRTTNRSVSNRFAWPTARRRGLLAAGKPPRVTPVAS